MKRQAALALSLAFCMFLVACSGPKTFNRCYESEDGSEQVEFFDDGTVEVFSEGMVVTGTYKRVDKNTYEIRLNVLFAQMRCTGVIEGKTLTLTEIGSENLIGKYYLKK